MGPAARLQTPRQEPAVHSLLCPGNPDSLPRREDAKRRIRGVLLQGRNQGHYAVRRGAGIGVTGCVAAWKKSNCPHALHDQNGSGPCAAATHRTRTRERTRATYTSVQSVHGQIKTIFPTFSLFS